MAQRGERKCIVCGTKYTYCPNCGNGDPKDSYKFIYDKKECEDVFNICSRYHFGELKAADALKRLEKYELSDLSNYANGVKSDILAIRAEGKTEPFKPENKGGDNKNNGNKFVNTK